MQKKILGALGVIVLLTFILAPAARATLYTFNTPFTVGTTSSSIPALAVTDAGYVGIGTASPTATLQVEGSMPVISLKKSLINQTWQLRTGGRDTFSAGFDIYNPANKVSALYASTEGNITIGTTTSNLNSRLYVWGGPTGANIDVRGDERIYGGDQATIELEGYDYDIIPNSALLQYYGSNGVGSTMGFPNNRLGHIQFGDGTVGIVHTTNAAPLVFGTNNIERMRIAPDGNVGIGIANPQSLFQVAATSTATTTITVGDLTNAGSKSCVNMKTAAGTAVSFYFDATGNMVVENNYCK